MNEKLLQCPFCGEDADYYISGVKGYVHCTRCGSKTNGSYAYKESDWEKTEAHLWNTRVSAKEEIKDNTKKENGMKRELLEEAANIVEGQRKEDYGETYKSFERISNLWSAYLSCPVSPSDIAAMMIMLKISRAKQTPTHKDSWVDMAGYAACGYEVSQKEEE